MELRHRIVLRNFFEHETRGEKHESSEEFHGLLLNFEGCLLVGSTVCINDL